MNALRRYRAGDTIAGVYHVLHVFEGGLGIVYVVEHTSGDRIVLKTLKDESLQAAQFRREAETWVRVGSHPNVVKALWVDVVAGALCVAAEFIEPDEIGRLSLRDYLRFGALTAIQIVRCAAQFCYGLEHAINGGLVSHRDIKPENLLIGNAGVLKITDFGIASAAPFADDAQPERPRLGRWRSVRGEISGTPPYMAPEQIAGSREQDQRVDIYAFGVVLYEMAYGTHPFAGCTPTEFFHLHLNTRPRIPSGPFAELIDRCLMKAPNHRHSSVTEFLFDLQRICRVWNLPLPPRPEPTDTRLEELRTRAYSFGALGRLDQAIECARELVRQAPRDSSSWTQLGKLLLERGDLVSAKEATNRSLVLDPTRSAPWNNLGLVFNREGRWHEAVEALDRALDCDPQNTGAMLNASEPLSKVGKTVEAVRRLRRATEIAPDKFHIWTNLASLYVRMGNRAHALECFQRARDLAPQGYRDQIDECIQNAHELPQAVSAEMLLADGRVSEAKERLRETVRDTPDDKDAWHNLGLCHLNDREYPDARQCFSQVYRLDKGDGFAVCRLIELAAMGGDLDDAEKWCGVLKSLPSGQIPAIAFKARVLAQCDRYQEAKALILDAVRKYPNELDILIACGDLMMWYPGSETAMSNAIRAYHRAAEILRLNASDIQRQREIEGRLRQAQENLRACSAGTG